MYAVIQTGGKQYRVAEGDMIQIELLDKELKEKITFDQVLLIASDSVFNIGNPMVDGASVVAEVICHDRHKKVLIFKKKRTTTYQRTQGHRQGFTKVRILQIRSNQ